MIRDRVAAGSRAGMPPDEPPAGFAGGAGVGVPADDAGGGPT